MAQHGRKRQPVFHGTIDDVVGVLHAVDVADALARSDDTRSAGQLARGAPWVPEDLGILDAFRVICARGAHILLVKDAQAGFAGLATVRGSPEPSPRNTRPGENTASEAKAWATTAGR